MRKTLWIPLGVAPMMGASVAQSPKAAEIDAVLADGFSAQAWVEARLHVELLQV